MSLIKHYLTIPAPFKGGNDWVSLIGSYMIADKVLGADRTITVTVERRPDQFSFRFAEMADRARTGSPAQFPEASITREEIEANGMPVSESIYDFFDVKVTGFIPRSKTEESIEFSVGRYTKFEISNIQVFFD
jgi:hypothetical protein